MLSVKHDAVLIIVHIWGILEAPLTVIDGNGNDSVAVSYTHLDVYKRQKKNNTNPPTFEKERSTNSCCTKSSRSSARNYLLPDYTNPGVKVNILLKEYRYLTTNRLFFEHIAQ